MLIIMHNRNVCRFSDSAFDLETFWRLDILEIDSSKRLGNIDNGLDKFLWIRYIDFNIEDIDICEGFEQQSFPFHDRFTRKSPNIAET